MKNTKEIQPILTALFCLNRISENENKDITLVLDYAFRSLFGSNTNLLILACIGEKEDIHKAVFDILGAETKYNQYLEEYKSES